MLSLFFNILSNVEQFFETPCISTHDVSCYIKIILKIGTAS